MKIKYFTDEQKLREFTTSRATVKEMLKESSSDRKRMTLDGYFNLNKGMKNWKWSIYR